MMDFLISMEADLNHRGNENLTPLYLATIHKKYLIIRSLISKGCDVNHSTKSRGTMLENAIFEGRYYTAKFLLEESDVLTSVK